MTTTKTTTTESKKFSYVEIKEMWSHNHETEEMMHFIVDYANANKIYWCDVKCEYGLIIKVLRFARSIYRHFNDGDDIRWLTCNEDIDRARLDKKILEIKKVYKYLKNK